MKYQASELYGYALHWAAAQVFGLEVHFRYDNHPNLKPELYALQIECADAGSGLTDWFAQESYQFKSAIHQLKISVVYQPEFKVWKATMLGSELEQTGIVMFEAVERLIVNNSYPDGLEVPKELHHLCSM